MKNIEASLSQAERVDAACDRFEAAWKAGKAPRVDDLVAAAPEADRAALRSALLAVAAELESADSPDTTKAYAGSVETMPAAIGRFEIKAMLGHGAFGRVYRAVDPQLGREVAVKVPLVGHAPAAEETERFLREARAAATINHPNVCQVYEVGAEGGRPYIVMALVPGHSLADALKARKQPMDAKQAGIAVRKIALALAAAHDKGVVHRDLKPANVMFDRERKDLVVMDFGLARGPRLGDARATQSGVVMGTPAYMSPEQARGDSKDVGPAADIYSLGVILYELLCGQRPFAGTATEVIGQILHVEPEAPSARRAGVDPRLEAACLKAMAKDPSARFASMREFAAALDGIVRSPQPASPSAETVRAAETRVDGDERSSGTKKVAEIFAAMSVERRATRAETAAVVEAALAKHRTPRWMLVAGLLAAFGAALFGGIQFFTRSEMVKVNLTVELKDVDLKDRTLSFFLDEKPVPAEALAIPVELKPGEHVFVVRRGDVTVKRILLTVAGGREPGLVVKDITPPAPPPPFDPSTLLKGPWKLVYTPQYLQGISPQYKRYRPAPPDGVRFENGLFLQTNMPARRNTAIRGRARRLGAQHIQLVLRYGAGGGYYAIWEPDKFRIECQEMVGKEKRKSDLARVDVPKDLAGDELELAFAARGEDLYLFANGRLVAAAKDQRFGTGYIGAGAGPGQAVIAGFEQSSLEGPALDPERTAAARLFLLAAKLGVASGDGPLRDARNLADVPPGPMVVKNVEVPGGMVTQLSKWDFPAVAACPQLERFSLRGSAAEAPPGELVAVLARIATLRELDFSRYALDDAALAGLQPLPNLESLSLQASRVTAEGLAPLAKFPALRRLVLNNCRVGNDALPHVAAAKLQRLELRLTDVDDAGVPALAAMNGLRELALDGSKVTAEGIVKLRAALPNCLITPSTGADTPDRIAALRTLALRGTVAVRTEDEEAARPVAAADELPAGPVRLTAVRLANRNIGDEALDMLADLKALTELDLEHTRVTSQGVRKLGGVRTLQSLNLFFTPIGPDALDALGGLVELRTLNLGANRLAGADWGKLRAMTKLTTLNLYGTPIDSAGLDALAGLPIAELNLARCPKLNPACLTALARLPALKSLDLTEAKLSDADVPQLGKLANLATLNLTAAGLTAAGRAAVRDALPACRLIPAP